jgi:RNA polymerase sigma factor (sigma-70 family)
MVADADEVTRARDKCRRKIQTERLRSALAELPPKCYNAYVLVEYHKRSYEEAAAEMGIAAGQVRLLVLRAIEHLAKATLR